TTTSTTTVRSLSASAAPFHVSRIVMPCPTPLPPGVCPPPAFAVPRGGPDVTAGRSGGADRSEEWGMTEHADVIVVGMGPGGEDVAERLADAGLDVVGVDAELVGGECPYWGCVPSKMMIRAADLLAEARRVPGRAGRSRIDPDWSPVAARIRDEATDDWDDAVAVKRFEDKGGRFVRGWVRLEGPGRVAVGDRAFEAGRAV